MIKAATLFLIFIVVLAMFGRLRFPGAGPGKRGQMGKPRKCPSCGRYQIGAGPCACGGDRKG